MEPAETDPNAELKLRQVFIKPDETLARDQIRTLNVLRGQAKCDSIDATDKFRAMVTSSLSEQGGKKKGAKNCNVEPENAQAVPQKNPLANITPEVAYAAVLKYIAESAPITVNIHPSVLKLVSDDGYLRSVFEVNKKGDAYIQSRINFESVCFLKLYDSAVKFERPKYGALNFLNLPGGISSASVYGKWHLVLKDAVRRRCTLAPGDTFGVSTIGVLDFCTHVLCYLTGGEIRELVKIALGIIPHGTKYEGSYREIQIHGEVRCDRDFAALHVPKGDDLKIAEEFSQKYNIPLVLYDL